MTAPDYLGAEPDAGSGPSVRQRGLDEPNYYEIALTSKQVLVGFVILLACVVVAFFAGVWVGTSGATAERAETAQAGGPADGRAAAARPAPARPRPGAQRTGPAAGSARPAVVAGKPAEDQPPAEEFQFFSENEEAPRRQAGAGGPAARPPHRARGEGVRPQPGGATPAQAPPAAGAGTVVSGTPDGPGVPEPAAPPRATSAPPSTAAAPAAPAPAPVRELAAPRPAAPAAAASGRTVVQVFSSTDDDQARKVQQRLQSAGYAASISSLAKDGTTMHRVRVGPFPSEAEANRVAAEIKSRLRLDTWVTTP